jgi:hypothetical protein
MNTLAGCQESGKVKSLPLCLLFRLPNSHFVLSFVWVYFPSSTKHAAPGGEVRLPTSRTGPGKEGRRAEKRVYLASDWRPEQMEDQEEARVRIDASVAVSVGCDCVGGWGCGERKGQRG